jgi:hypothetical protein
MQDDIDALPQVDGDDLKGFQESLKGREQRKQRRI